MHFRPVIHNRLRTKKIKLLSVRYGRARTSGLITSWLAQGFSPPIPLALEK
jgi:hypothetical protein